MICRNCETKFHYCSSCGYEFSLDNGFCRDSCAETYYKSKLVDTQTVQPIDEEVAELVIRCEDSTPYYIAAYAKEKISVHSIIAEKLLSGNMCYDFS